MNLISKVIEYWTGNFRLIIEYILIAVVVALCGLSAAMWFQKAKLRADLAEVKTDLAVTKGNLTTLEAAKAVQDNTIADLKELRKKDSEAIFGLTSDYKTLHKKDASVRTRLAELEKKDEAVRKYLDTPLPASLRCVLDGACDQNGSGGQGSEGRSTSRPR